jgi:hypothetical protein
MSRVLHLTNDQFEVLYDLLEDTINDMEVHLEDSDMTLNDYHIYHVFKQLNKIGGKS